MKVLIIGGGGREHALAWKAMQSSQVEQVLVAPGNAGTAREPGVDNVALAPDDKEALVELARREAIELTIVGPEAPLVDGIVNLFRAQGLPCFGPEREAAQLEGSKAFTKDFLARHGIPSAEYLTFTERDAALEHVRARGAPLVIKADGLASGKGVVVAQELEEAETAVREMLSGEAFGEAGEQIVIEDFLQGEEASFIVLADGEQMLPLATSQDHKRIGDGDTGANTGGMGAYSPAPVVTDRVYQRILDEVIHPTLRGMAAEGRPYTGFLYAGLMITPDGSPKVIEFNCRLGDPEAQPLLMRLQSDLVAHCRAALDGRLDAERAQWDERTALGVVMAAGGYPGSYRKGDAITGLESLDSDRLKVFHAGTADDEQGRVVTAGGRVLCVTALGDALHQARDNAYAGASSIQWSDCYYRTDIGYRALTDC